MFLRCALLKWSHAFWREADFSTLSICSSAQARTGAQEKSMHKYRTQMLGTLLRVRRSLLMELTCGLSRESIHLRTHILYFCCLNSAWYAYSKTAKAQYFREFNPILSSTHIRIYKNNPTKPSGSNPMMREWINFQATCGRFWDDALAIGSSLADWCILPFYYRPCDTIWVTTLGKQCTEYRCNYSARRAPETSCSRNHRLYHFNYVWHLGWVCNVDTLKYVPQRPLLPCSNMMCL